MDGTPLVISDIRTMQQQRSSQRSRRRKKRGVVAKTARRKKNSRGGSRTLETMPIEAFAEMLQYMDVTDLLHLLHTRKDFLEDRLAELRKLKFKYRPNRPLTTRQLQFLRRVGLPLGEFIEHRIDAAGGEGTFRMEGWYLNGSNILHNDQGPAYIKTVPDEEITTIRYYDHGQIHRADGPAEIITSINSPESTTKTERYYEHGQTHRADGPALITVLSEHGRVIQRHEDYMVYGKHHRVDGPAVISQYEDGSFSKDWYLNGVKTRGNGEPRHVLGSKPATINRFHNGTVMRIWNDVDGDMIEQTLDTDHLEEDLADETA